MLNILWHLSVLHVTKYRTLRACIIIHFTFVVFCSEEFQLNSSFFFYTLCNCFLSPCHLDYSHHDNELASLNLKYVAKC